MRFRVGDTVVHPLSGRPGKVTEAPATMGGTPLDGMVRFVVPDGVYTTETLANEEGLSIVHALTGAKDGTDRPACAGPRQTVDRAHHPQRGDGWAIYDNGPSAFVPDSGKPIMMHVRFGGCGQNGAFLNANDPNHGAVVLPVLVRGELHHRKWHAVLGGGWLVWEVG